MKLDFSIKTKQGRIDYINELIKEQPDLPAKHKEYISDYLLFTADKRQTKIERDAESPILTRNREVTINKRQVSFEEMVDRLENGEDGIYALITNDKNQIMDRREKLNDDDMENIPGVKDMMRTIDSLKEQFDKASGYQKYALKRQIIETWQQIYILKSSYKGMTGKGRTSNQIKQFARMPLPEHVTINPETMMPESDCAISLFNPTHVSFLLCYYSQLKQECEDDFQSDMHFLLMDLENLAEEAIHEESDVLWDLLVWKVDGYTNEEIKKMMDSKYGITHNEQYFSTLWRKKIPKMIADQASKNWILWHYTNEEYGKWKVCGKCGQTKLAHPLFFSKNNTRDHFYSVCKECRSTKNNSI